jgi:hypothetical protein
MGITVSTYFFTKKMHQSNSDALKKKYMRYNIVLILMPLFFFKYFNAINAELIETLKYLHLSVTLPEFSLLLPIGISFYTFMAIGYTIDVYNEEVPFENNIGILALFISFFPLILSGPIERAKNMLPQFRSQKVFEYENFVKGSRIMLWGYFMKLVVADRLGIYISAIFENIAHHNGTTLLFGSLLYPFQLYADLGGYSLIAIGTSKILGFNVMNNFNRPFFSKSMSEFWRRWHISLITWLTDYIYTPLSFHFRKYKISGIVISLMITFLISGIWHGATINFIFWGLFQGIIVSYEAITNKRKTNLELQYNLNKKIWYSCFQIFSTYLLFASSQIFGKTTTINESFLVFNKILFSHGKLFIGQPSTFIFCILGLLMLFINDLTDEYFPNLFLFFNNKNKTIRMLSYSIIIIIILLIGVLDGGQFIYFQF